MQPSTSAAHNDSAFRPVILCAAHVSGCKKRGRPDQPCAEILRRSPRLHWLTPMQLLALRYDQQLQRGGRFRRFCRSSPTTLQGHSFILLTYLHNMPLCFFRATIPTHKSVLCKMLAAKVFWPVQGGWVSVWPPIPVRCAPA